MDFDRHSLYCYECKDYIYDTEIDEKIIRAELLSSKLKESCKSKGNCNIEVSRNRV